MRLLRDTLRVIARIVLWLPIKAVRFFAAIAIVGTLLDRIDVASVLTALAAGLTLVLTSRLQRCLRGAPA